MLKAHFDGILGINIGKIKIHLSKMAKMTPDLYGKAHAYAGYIAINISSPNTPGYVRSSMAMRWTIC